jgi:hypothetical protein
MLQLVVSPRFALAEGFLNLFFAAGSDTASLTRAGQKSLGRYPLAPTGAIWRKRSHVAKKSCSQPL